MLWTVSSTVSPAFQSTLPAWGATSSSANKVVHGKFQSTLPAWGATDRGAADSGAADISIHAPRVGSDGIIFVFGEDLHCISIHAPRVGSDDAPRALPRPASNFNPRSPRGERRLPCLTMFRVAKFQSTLPAWGATHGRDVVLFSRRDFNPRSPRGERHASLIDVACMHDISIHAPRVGSDRRTSSLSAPVIVFQSTLPAWGATAAASSESFCARFQSTLPAWGATPSAA